MCGWGHRNYTVRCNIKPHVVSKCVNYLPRTRTHERRLCFQYLSSSGSRDCAEGESRNISRCVWQASFYDYFLLTPGGGMAPWIRYCCPSVYSGWGGGGGAGVLPSVTLSPWQVIKRFVSQKMEGSSNPGFDFFPNFQPFPFLPQCYVVTTYVQYTSTLMARVYEAVAFIFVFDCRVNATLGKLERLYLIWINRDGATVTCFSDLLYKLHTKVNSWSCSHMYRLHKIWTRVCCEK